MAARNKHISLVSETFPEKQMDAILGTPNTFFDNVHYLYPADEKGAHLLRFFSLDQIARKRMFVYWIVDDIVEWAQKTKIVCDVVFAPFQPGVAAIASTLAVMLSARPAFWEYLPSGRFGERLVEGEINSGDKVLVFNGVSQQGRCIGSRLPEFVNRFQGQVVAAAVFAKGTNRLVSEAEKLYGQKFYSAIKVDIPVFTPPECPKCLGGDKATLEPWTNVLK